VAWVGVRRALLCSKELRFAIVTGRSPLPHIRTFVTPISLSLTLILSLTHSLLLLLRLLLLLL